MTNGRDRTVGRTNLIFGWLGTVLLFAIIGIKLLRFRDRHGMAAADPTAASFLVGVAPSLLGPAGILFLLLSGTGRMARFTLFQMTIIVAACSFGLEFAQLLPRPGFLARIHYTFDYYDLAATLCSVLLGYGISSWVLRKPPISHGRA